MKACHSCESFQKSILHPYCLKYEQYIKHGPDRDLVPVHSCLRVEEQRDVMLRSMSTTSFMQHFYEKEKA